MSNKTFGELFQSSGGGAAAGGWARAFVSSGSVTFTQAGDVVLSYAGPGGGGAVANNNTNGSATGGNSGPWGRKKIRVASGDVLVVNIAAGGLKGVGLNTNGSAGSTGTVLLNGVTIMTIQGGEGGAFSLTTATATAPTPSATVTGADLWVSGIQAGTAQSSGSSATSGGAALDALQTGLGRSPNASGPGATGLGGSLGTNAGGVPLPWTVLAEWGFAVVDGNNATAQTGAPGRGGVSNTVKAGVFGGGANGSIAGPGGQGAGGSGGGFVALAGNGGDAYAYMTFTPLS